MRGDAVKWLTDLHRLSSVIRAPVRRDIPVRRSRRVPTWPDNRGLGDHGRALEPEADVAIDAAICAFPQARRAPNSLQLAGLALILPTDSTWVDRDPVLGSVGLPVEGEVLLELGEVVGHGVEGGGGAGAAEGDVGEFSSAAGGEDVGAIVGGALGAVDGEGVAVVQVLAVDRLSGEQDPPPVGALGFERVFVGVGAGDGEALAGDEALVREWSEDDDLVPGGVGPSSGSD